MNPGEQLPIEERTTVGRRPQRQVTDRAVLYRILDSALVAHLAVVRDGEPLVLPVACARDGDALLLHGSTAAGALRLAASGAPVSVAITLIDGLVIARSVFDNSMNYRSAVIFGVPEVLEDDDKVAALTGLTDHLLPGRWDEVRPSTAKELAATLVLRLRLDSVSVKVRAEPAAAEPGDGEDRAAWVGVVPLAILPGDPVPGSDVPTGTPVPGSVGAFTAGLMKDSTYSRHAADPT